MLNNAKKAEKHFMQKLYSSPADLESVRLLAHPGGDFDFVGSTMTEALHLGATPLHNVIRQICGASKQLAVPPVLI